MKRRTMLFAGSITMLLLLTGCSSSDPEPAPADTETAAPEPADTAAPAEGDTLSITTTDYAFDAPSEVAAGSYTIELTNDGEEMHEAIIVELLEGKTMEEALEYIETSGPDSPPPSWARVAAFAFAAPGESAQGMPASPEGEPGGEPGTSVELTAGTYAMLCFVPEGTTSEDSKPAKDAKPHVALGMVHELTVT